MAAKDDGAGREDLVQANLSEILKQMSLSKKAEEDAPEQLLEEVSFEGVAQYIREGKCKKIITMAGAGISTSAGIPDFRSPDTGLYHNLQQYNLPHPQAIFCLDFFVENPKPFFVLAKELWPGLLKPTPCHYFIKMLQEKGLLLRHYTQNIDTLERLTGMEEERIVEAHGTFHSAHCIGCKLLYTSDWMKAKIFADEIPECEECGCVVKPDIVFFGEDLPERFRSCVNEDFKECDLLVVMGTSLKVMPFASLTKLVPKTTPRLYINLEKTADEPSFMFLMGGRGGGFNFEGEDNYRDVFQQDTCDDGCYALADLLGWGKELRQMVTSEHAKIDKKFAEEASKTSPTAAGKPNPGDKSSKKTSASGSPRASTDKPKAKDKSSVKTPSKSSASGSPKTSPSKPKAGNESSEKTPSKRSPTGSPTASIVADTSSKGRL